MGWARKSAAKFHVVSAVAVPRAHNVKVFFEVRGPETVLTVKLGGLLCAGAVPEIMPVEERARPFGRAPPTSDQV